RILLQDALDDGAGAVLRAVLDEDDLGRPPGALERGQQLEHARLEVTLLVVAGDDHADVGHVGHRDLGGAHVRAPSATAGAFASASAASASARNGARLVLPKRAPGSSALIRTATAASRRLTPSVFSGSVSGNRRTVRLLPCSS